MIELLHTVLVLAFLGVTFGLLVMMVLQRTRMHGVCMSWQRNAPGAAWPIVFVGVIGVLAVLAHNTANGFPGWIFAGYMLGGLMWFTAVVLGATVVVSRYGVVKGFDKRDSALAWIQIQDYFEVPHRSNIHFVFFFRDADGIHRRLEIPVPIALADQFRSLVTERMDQRQTPQSEPAQGRRAIS